MIKDWYDIYIEEIKLKKNIIGYVNYKIKNKKKLINLIKKYSKRKKIMEAGSGTGIISTYMASLGYDVTEVDIDDKILNLAKDISKKYIKKGEPNFIKKDLLKLDFKSKEFDVIFSNGVLEHFNDDDIKKILKNELEQASFVIVGIPTTFFNQNEALYGDERFLKLSYWRKIFKSCNAIILEEKSYNYMTFIEKLSSLNKIFKPKPFRIFVLKKR